MEILKIIEEMFGEMPAWAGKMNESEPKALEHLLKFQQEVMAEGHISKKEKELIAKMKAKIEEDDAKRLGIKCPKCEGMLIETDFEKIKIDVCEKCSGVWLDAGELTMIADKDEETGWFGKLFG